MSKQLYVGPVIEAGTSHGLFSYLKPEGLDQVQRGVRGGAGPRDRAGILRYLGFYEYDVHCCYALSAVLICSVSIHPKQPVRAD